MMRTAARPGQAVARSPEVDWRAPDPTTAPPSGSSRQVHPFKVRDGERG